MLLDPKTIVYDCAPTLQNPLLLDFKGVSGQRRAQYRVQSPHDSATKQLPCLDCELYFSYIAFLSSVGCTAEPGEPQKTLCLRNRDVAATGHAICRHSPQASTASPLLCWHCSVRSCLCVLLIHNKVTSPSDCMRRIARAFMSEQRARHWTSSKP